MKNNTYILRANHINDRLYDVYKECFNEMIEAAKKNCIVKISFGLHNDLGIDVPCLVFEKEDFDHKQGRFINTYSYEELGEMVFDESYNHITLIGKNLSYAYMDDGYGDFFDVSKIGQIFQAFMEIVGNDDLKPIELK